MPRPGQVGEAGTRGRVGTSGGVVEEAGWKGGGAQAGGAWAWRRRRTPDVGRDEDAVLEVLEGLVELDALGLLDARVDGHRGEVALLQQLVELDGALDRLDEDDNLVKLEHIKKVVELSVLFGFGKLDVVQLKAVESELGVIIDVDLHRILAELSADGSDFRAEGGAEHHHLLLMGRHSEDLLDITAHFKGLEDTIALIENEVLDVIQL